MHNRKWRLPIFVAVFGLIGVGVLVLTQAATNNYFVEPETSTVAAGATVVTDGTASGGSAIKFAQPVAGTCSGAKHTAGGDDGMGGCWPGPDNTGVPAGTSLTTYSSPCTITVANTVIDAKNIQCDEIEVNASNVTISRSLIKHHVGGSGTFTITDSEIDGALANFGGVACVNCGVDGHNFTILRTEIKHTNRSAYCSNTCNIRDSWFHGVNLDTSPCPQASSGTCPHASALRAEQNVTAVHNTLACDFMGPYNDDLGCSADMSGYPDFAPIKNNTIDSNLFVANEGNGFCAYGGATATKPFSNDPTNATNVIFKNNIFQRGTSGVCGAYGAVTAFDYTRSGNQWTNNKYDNGTALLCDATHDCL